LGASVIVINKMNLIDQQIEKPTLLLDKSKVLRNIDRMADKAERNGLLLRPHFKTHQSAEIGEWFRERGVHAITVSSVEMAEYFVDHDWRDITIAFPINLRQIRRINALSTRSAIGTLVESKEAVHRLDLGIDGDLSIWLKIDAGYHRTGVPWDDDISIEEVAAAVINSKCLRLSGILTHSGHTYGSASVDEIRAIYTQVHDRMVRVKRKLYRAGFEVAISVGDTPACSVVEDFGDVDEIRPGNFVFYDLSQHSFGACEVEDVAVAVACPVVAKHSDRGQVVIYGGAIHLSKERMPGSTGQDIYGRIALFDEDHWLLTDKENEVISLSQEHGIVQTTKSLFNRVEVGDYLLVLPVHSCLTANLLGRYLTLEGDLIEMARF
jgi:D-serine deaminase-like pyridoxal phosphate-dependent protein